MLLMINLWAARASMVLATVLTLISLFRGNVPLLVMSLILFLVAGSVLRHD